MLDRGPGISPSDLERIFEKFYRGTRGSGTVEGSGIGLAIAKGIVEAHGGAIWAENRARWRRDLFLNTSARFK